MHTSPHRSARYALMSTAVPRIAQVPNVAFYRNERPRLIAAGITDYNAQCTELKRRWDVMQALKTASPPAASFLAVGEVGVYFDAPLGADDLAAMSCRCTHVCSPHGHLPLLRVEVHAVWTIIRPPQAVPLRRPRTKV